MYLNIWSFYLQSLFIEHKIDNQNQYVYKAKSDSKAIVLGQWNFPNKN